MFIFFIAAYFAYIGFFHFQPLRCFSFAHQLCCTFDFCWCVSVACTCHTLPPPPPPVQREKGKEAEGSPSLSSPALTPPQSPQTVPSAPNTPILTNPLIKIEDSCKYGHSLTAVCLLPSVRVEIKDTFK